MAQQTITLVKSRPGEGLSGFSYRFALVVLSSFRHDFSRPGAVFVHYDDHCCQKWLADTKQVLNLVNMLILCYNMDERSIQSHGTVVNHWLNNTDSNVKKKRKGKERKKEIVPLTCTLNLVIKNKVCCALLLFHVIVGAFTAFRPFVWDYLPALCATERHRKEEMRKVKITVSEFTVTFCITEIANESIFFISNDSWVLALSDIVIG